METFGTNGRCTGTWFDECSIAQIYTHLSADFEKSRYQVVRFQNTVYIHVMNKGTEGFRWIPRVSRAVMHLHPFSQQKFCLLK